ncbi:MAG: ATP-binding protein [Spirulina sp.]
MLKLRLIAIAIAPMSNPFYVSGPVPPEYFVGRKPEVNDAFDQILKCSHASFYGSSGMGKSSLLQLLLEPQVWVEYGHDSSLYFIIYLNCTDINPFSSRRFWQQILRSLYEEIEAEDELRNAIEEVSQKEDIEKGDVQRIVHKIGKSGKYLLLLLDDYDPALRPNDRYTESAMLAFLSEFRNFAIHGKASQYLSLIVTSSRKLTELGPKTLPDGSPWYNYCSFHAMKPYSEEEVKNNFFEGSSRFFIPIKPSFKKEVLSMTGGHPALLQNAGYMLYNIAREGKEIAIPEFMKKFYIKTEHIFRDIWRFSTEEEQILLMLIALSNAEGNLEDKNYVLGKIEQFFSKRGRELIALEKRGIIQEKEKNDDSIYLFTSSLMEWWVLQEIYNSDKEELIKREKLFLDLISREQWEQIKNISGSIWKNREIVKKVWNVANDFVPFL